uniref:Uncharacterized protein n=1 Tax=Setaria italica TaxID=4555 RepID=K3ZBQ5_SETIT
MAEGGGRMQQERFGGGRGTGIGRRSVAPYATARQSPERRGKGTHQQPRRRDHYENK